MNKNKENKKIEWNKDNILAVVGILFFVLLAIVVRVTGSGDSSLNNDSSNPTPTKTPEVENIDIETNYHFTYTIDIDGKGEVIDGSVVSSKAKFQILGVGKEEYIKLSNTYMRLINGEYQVLDILTVRNYLPYLDLEKIKELSSISTVNMDEDDVYLYSVEVTDLIDKYTDITYDSFSEFKTDSIEVTYTKKGYFKKIVLDYSNYFTYINKVDSTFKVIMEFDDYGKQTDFEI